MIRILVSDSKPSVLVSQRKMHAIVYQSRMRVIVSDIDNKVPIEGTTVSWFGTFVKWAQDILAEWR